MGKKEEFTFSKRLTDAIINYLAKKPYGEVIDLEENLGLKLKFEVVNNKKKTIPIEINKVKAETKVMDYTPDDKFFKELQKIKGIGNKTAIDRD